MSRDSMSSPFTLTIDWLPFDTLQMLGGDWTRSETGFRGYPMSWITASKPNAMLITILKVSGKGWMRWRQDGRLAQI